MDFQRFSAKTVGDAVTGLPAFFSDKRQAGI
mgnify:CR=1 FL=1